MFTCVISKHLNYSVPEQKSAGASLYQLILSFQDIILSQVINIIIIKS